MDDCANPRGLVIRVISDIRGLYSDPRRSSAVARLFRASQAELPTLRTEATSSGRFAQLAAQEIATIEAEVEFVTLYRKAIAESDSDTWNEAIDASAKVDTAREALEAEIDKQCDFWRSR